MSFALPSVATDVPQLLALRRLVNRGFVGALFLFAVLDPVVCLFSGMSLLVAGGIAALMAALGAALVLRDPDSLFGRVAVVACLMTNYDLLIYATSYTPYQLDAHMLYFALAAMMIGFCCWITLAAAALHTALHHLMLNVLLPEYVFPGGADWAHFLTHAALLILQFVGSAVIAVNVHGLFSRSHAAVVELQAASAEREEIRGREDAQARARQAERERAQATMAQAAEQQKGVVARLAEGLEKLSSGALDCRIDAAFPAEYEELRANFNAAIARIGEALAMVADNTGAIRNGAGEISGVAEDVANRADQQSQSLRATVDSLNAITGDLNATAQGAGVARDVVASAKDDAEASAAVVREAIAAMSGIETSSRQIGQIIGVIDEIAFQTNLLALNAGVEAARAGEFGRGFAVVASEVRGLAQRSAEAAKEIKALISTSSAQVEQGVELVRRSGEALARISGEIVEINKIVTGIAEKTKAQSASLGDVNRAVSGMDRGVRESADMFMRSAGETRSLAAQTEELQRQIGYFRFDRKERDPARQAA